MTVTLEPSRAKPPTAPGLLDLEITRRRQLTCRSHCYAEAGPTQGHGTMTTDEWKRVISEAAAIGTERIQLIGGGRRSTPISPSSWSTQIASPGAGSPIASPSFRGAPL
ncbi:MULTISPECIES: hypothetical protein [unclassified Streptomyces]|uniref:hypothetical protein n=1 Tax=unclassified Streptomyces TaxID=2593676 RepID=UPI0033168495